MKSLSYVIVSISLISCAQLMSGQEQSVKLLKTNLYMTTCSGAVENWGSCNNKANRTCNGNYVVLEKNESIVGGKRELFFECKK